MQDNPTTGTTMKEISKFTVTPAANNWKHIAIKTMDGEEYKFAIDPILFNMSMRQNNPDRFGDVPQAAQGNLDAPKDPKAMQTTDGPQLVDK